MHVGTVSTVLSNRWKGFFLYHFSDSCLAFSKTDAGNTLSKATDSKVYSYRDRHSDSLCYQTVGEAAQEALAQARHVVVTVCPGQYCPFTPEAKSHSIIGRPHLLQ